MNTNSVKDPKVVDKGIITPEGTIPGDTKTMLVTDEATYSKGEVWSNKISSNVNYPRLDEGKHFSIIDALCEIQTTSAKTMVLIEQTSRIYLRSCKDSVLEANRDQVEKMLDDATCGLAADLVQGVGRTIAAVGMTAIAIKGNKAADLAETQKAEALKAAGKPPSEIDIASEARRIHPQNMAYAWGQGIDGGFSALSAIPRYLQGEFKAKAKEAEGHMDQARFNVSETEDFLNSIRDNERNVTSYMSSAVANTNQTNRDVAHNV